MGGWRFMEMTNVLPATYQIPAAVVLILGGALACFAGYRFFRIVLGVYGFIFGAFLASSFVAASDRVAMIIAALVGGLVGAVAMYAGYFLGVVLIGAGLGAIVAGLFWNLLGWGEPHWIVIGAFAAAGSLVAWTLQRQVVILATAAGGAWTLLGGVVSLADAAGPRRLRAGDIWIDYPGGAAFGRRWVLPAWIVLTVVGMMVQLRTTKGRKMAPKSRKR